MFRLQNNVPEIYVNESRDFQILCRLYDSVLGGVKYSIDSLQRSSSTPDCDNTLLDLLKTKLGLFTSLEAEEYALRYVLQCYPHLIRYKGSKKAVNDVLTLFSRISNAPPGDYDPEILEKEHRLVLKFTQTPKSDKLLLEILKYILPIGYIVEYIIVDSSITSTSHLKTNDNIIIEATPHKKNIARLGRTDSSDNIDETGTRNDDISMYNTVGVTSVTKGSNERES